VLCPTIAKVSICFSFAYVKELFIASLLALTRKAINVPDAEDNDTSLFWFYVYQGKYTQ
jgi:hypothetical protein